MALIGSFRGTAFLYQGEELGLPEVKIAYEDVQDPWGKYLYEKWQGRDGARTPMPWCSGHKSGGFSTSPDTWLPVPVRHLELSAAEQEKQENSQLNFTRAFLMWRKQNQAMVRGDISFITYDDPRLLIFARSDTDQKIICIFNLSDQEKCIDDLTVVISGSLKSSFKGSVANVQGDRLALPPYGFVFFETSSM